MSLRSLHLTPLISGVCLVVLSASPSVATEGHLDPGRNLVEQKEAARAAANDAALAEPRAVARYLADRSAWVRDAVLDALVTRVDAESFERLVPLLAHPDPLVAAAVAEACGERAHAGAREALERAARTTTSEEVALEAVWALEALADPASATALEQVLDRRCPPRVRADALVALSRVDPARAVAPAREALRGRDLTLKIGALTALVRAAPAEGVAAATRIIDEIDGRDAAEARLLYAALGQLRAWADGPWAEDRPPADLELLRGAIDVLVKRLTRLEAGRPRADVAAALRALTGSTGLGADDAAWRDWWQAARVGFVPPDRRCDAPAAGDAATTRTRVEFHGLPVSSTRVVFVQDVSGGMHGPLDAADPRSPSRMAFSLDELRRVLAVLEPDAQVDVAFFATGLRRGVGRLVPAGPARRALIDFVTRVGGVTPGGQGQGRSNLHDTLANLLLDERIDTVYLLSEGGPTEGRYVDPARVLRHLARLNASRQVQVHCLQVTENRPGARFLRAVAQDTGGVFHTLDALLGARR
jgi:hypothetical protein